LGVVVSQFFFQCVVDVAIELGYFFFDNFQIDIIYDILILPLGFGQAASEHGRYLVDFSTFPTAAGR